MGVVGYGVVNEGIDGYGYVGYEVMYVWWWVVDVLY